MAAGRVKRRMATVKNLDLPIRPLLLLSIWILVAAFTLAQLGAVQPAPGAAGVQASQTSEPGPWVLEARTHPPRRRPLAR